MQGAKIVGNLVASPLVGDGCLTAVVVKPRRYFYHPLFAHYLTEGFGLLEGSDFSLPKKKKVDASKNVP